MIEFVHHPDVDGDEDNKDINTTLLGEPEAELKPADLKLIELFDKEDAAPVGNDEPDAHENANALKVSSPVGAIGGGW